MTAWGQGSPELATPSRGSELALLGARSVLALLIGLSVWSVSIMLERRRTLGALVTPELGALRSALQVGESGAIEQWVSRASGPGLAGRYARALLESEASRRAEVAQSWLAYERVELERGLSTLATVASNAPFIGLLGTVLGIIHAFAQLGEATGVGSVMSGISEALIATAFGLFVAIPAGVAYNVFSRRLRVLIAQCEALREPLVHASVRVGSPPVSGG